MRLIKIGTLVLLLLAATELLPLNCSVLSFLATAQAQTTQDRKAEADRLLQQGIQQFQTSQFKAALNSWHQALQIYREIKDRRREGAVLGDLGIVYNALGNYGEAIEYQEQSLAIVQEIKDRYGEGTALNNLGIAYDALGNYGKAIEYYEQSLAITREIKDRPGEGRTLGNLGIAYDALGNYGKAIEYYEQSLAITQRIKDRPGEERILGSLGIVYAQLGNYGKAIEYYEQSLAIAQKIKDRQDEGSALGDLGNAHLNLGNYAKAIEYHEQSLAIAQEIKDRHGEGRILGDLGNTYCALGNYAKAIEYHEQSLAIAQEIKDRHGEGTALNNLGYALFKSGNFPRAVKALTDGIVTWETLRQTGSGNSDANKVSIFEQQARTYRTLQQVLVAQHQPNTALEIAERGRARALVELLTKQLSGAEPVAMQKRSIDARAQQAVASPTWEQMQDIARTHNATLVEYSIIYDDFKGQQGLEVHDSALYIWVIKPNGQIAFRPVNLKPLWQQQQTSLEELVVDSRQGMSVGDRTAGGVVAEVPPDNASRANSLKKLQQLYHLLIAPIADLLPTDPTTHVIFIPQESLFLVPFAALPDSSGQYLIQQHTISISPAIQVLGLTQQQQQKLLPPTKTLSVLVAGNPIMPTVKIPGVDAPLVLPALPGTEKEALAVAKTLTTRALISKQATKQKVMQQMQTARIIHLATHGLLDDFKGLGVPGAIALAPDGTGQPNDGLLTADDILRMKLKAELVVLSACNTGRGRITGDGVIGLSRALISAGVPSVVVSLWSIPDAPTASLMTQFYQNLQRNPDKAQALRQAMLTTLRTNPDPIDWAAFTLIGEAQ